MARVLGDEEYEGSRTANLWSDEQKSHQAVIKDMDARQAEAH